MAYVSRLRAQNRYYREHHNLPTLEEAGEFSIRTTFARLQLYSSVCVQPGRTEFRNVVFNTIKGKATTAIIDIVNRCVGLILTCTGHHNVCVCARTYAGFRERDGGMGDRALLRKCIEIYEAMGEGNLDVYQSAFEVRRERICVFALRSTCMHAQSLLLATTKEYYARKSHEWVETDSTPQYCIKVWASLRVRSALRLHVFLGARRRKTSFTGKLPVWLRT